MSRYGQHHNVDNILRQPDGYCRSPPSRLCTLILLKIHLHPMGFYPFKWINECPYGLYFELYGSKPLIKVKPLHGIHVGDQILVVLIEFNSDHILELEIEVSIRWM